MIEENIKPYYFITIYKCKHRPLSLFYYQMLASILTMDEQSSYYKVYGGRQHGYTNATPQLLT